MLVLEGSEPDANECGGRLFVSLASAKSSFCKALGRLRLAGIHPAEGRRARRAAPGVYLCHPVHMLQCGVLGRYFKRLARAACTCDARAVRCDPDRHVSQGPKGRSGPTSSQKSQAARRNAAITVTTAAASPNAHSEMLLMILHEGIEFGLQLFVRSEQPDIEMAPVLHEFEDRSILLFRHVRIAPEQCGHSFTRYRPGTGFDAAGVRVHFHSP